METSLSPNLAVTLSVISSLIRSVARSAAGRPKVGLKPETKSTLTNIYAMLILIESGR